MEEIIVDYIVKSLELRKTVLKCVNIGCFKLDSDMAKEISLIDKSLAFMEENFSTKEEK